MAVINAEKLIQSVTKEEWDQTCAPASSSKDSLSFFAEVHKVAGELGELTYPLEKEANERHLRTAQIADSIASLVREDAPPLFPTQKEFVENLIRDLSNKTDIKQDVPTVDERLACMQIATYINSTSGGK